MFQPAVSVPADLLQCHNANFTRKAWNAGLRTDQRSPNETRSLRLHFQRGQLSKRTYESAKDVSTPEGEDASVDLSVLAYRPNTTRVELHLGGTHLAGSIHCHLVEPSTNQPKHGFFDVQVKQLSHERSSFTSVREDAPLNSHVFPLSHSQLRSFLMKLFKGRVIDTEGLCVVPGKHVWSLTVNVTVLQDDGNVLDASELAVLSLLLAHRRPEALILPKGSMESVRLFEEWERDPAPLSLLHTPLSCSFVLTRDPQQLALERQQAQNSGSTGLVASPLPQCLEIIADPTLEEVAAAASSITVVVNREGQVCALEKGGGPPVSMQHVFQAIALSVGEAAKHPEELGEGGVAGYWWSVIENALKKLELDRQTARQTQFQWAKHRQGVTVATPSDPEAKRLRGE